MIPTLGKCDKQNIAYIAVVVCVNVNKYISGARTIGT